jgi:PPOX class probable F420-dependent enzyme
MALKRSQIEMSDAEVREFLERQRTIVLTSIGPRGFPHPMPMWFLLEDDGAVRMTTFRKSQKVRNLERDPRVSLLAEDGEVYAELRGVVIESRAELIRDTDLALDTMIGIAGDDAPASEAARAGMRRIAEKRIVIRCKPERILSWDHRRLGGVY